MERNISFDDQRKLYYINLDFGADPETGKQVKQTKTATKITQARSILRRHEADRDKGLTILPKALTVTQWLNGWLLTIVTPNRAETTVYGYRSIIDTHITPALGSIPLQKCVLLYVNKTNIGGAGINNTKYSNIFYNQIGKMGSALLTVTQTKYVNSKSGRV